MEGTLETAKRPEKDFELLLELYSNEAGAYRNSQTILQEILSLEEVSDDTYRFATTHKIELQPRLYYYLLRDDFSGAVLLGGRFKVR